MKNSPMYENLHLPANTGCDVYQLSASVLILLSLYDTIPYLEVYVKPCQTFNMNV